ncbi:MAG: SRPBCC family protein [Lacipirellulaceae bacterium]
MKGWKKVLLGVFTVLAASAAWVLGVAVTRPDVFRVARSGVVAAPPERVYGVISDLSQWDAWSPWSQRDPAVKVEMSANTVGKGASYTWDGNSEVGAGRMEVTDAVAGERVTMDLEFTRPMVCKNVVTFQLAPEGDGSTRVTWEMEGPYQFMGKVMSVFIDMDKMCGDDFEQGLANLDTLMKSEPAATPPAEESMEESTTPAAEAAAAG